MKYNTENTHTPFCVAIIPFIWYHLHMKRNALVENEVQLLEDAIAQYGVVIYHTAGNLYFKKTIEGDNQPKSINQTQEQK